MIKLLWIMGGVSPVVPKTVGEKMWDLTLNRSKLPLLSSAPSASKYVCVTQKLGQIRYIPPSLKKETLVLTTKPNIIFVATLIICYIFRGPFEKLEPCKFLKVLSIRWMIIFLIFFPFHLFSLEEVWILIFL